MASLASDGIPMAEGSAQETRGIDFAEGIDKLENTGVSVIVDEGKDANCERYLMENGENYSKILEELEQENCLKDVDLKEISKEDDEKSNSSNVIDDPINLEDIPKGETTDRHFENGEVSQYPGEKNDENEQEDSLNNEEALKMLMLQNEHRNEPDESDSTSMLDLVPENSSKEFISEDCCEGDHLNQSDKIEERGEIEDVQVMESMERKGTDQVEDNAMVLPIQDYELESSAVVKHLEPEETVDPKSLESTVSETQNTIEEYVFQSGPETKSSPVQTDTPSFGTKSNEYDEEKIHVDTQASLQLCSTPVSESSFLEPEEVVDNNSLEGTASETQSAIEKDIFHYEPESKSSLTQTDTPRFETQSNEYDGEKIHVDTEAGLEFSSLLASENSSLEPEEIVDQKSLESTASLEPEEIVDQKSLESTGSETQNTIEEDIFHHKPELKNLQMQTDTPSYDTKSNEYDGDRIHVDAEARLESSSMLESESFSAELVDQKSLENTASETENVIEEDIFHCEPETKSLVMQTDTSSFEKKSNEFDAEKIHAGTDASLVFSSMLESESSSPFRYVEDPSRGPNRGHDPKQKFEDCEMGLEHFSTPESNSLSIPTDNEDFIAGSTEDDSYITAKSDTFSLLHENSISTESQSTEDAKSVSRRDVEIDDFDRTTTGREPLSIDQSLEMHNDEAKNEKDMECEATDRDVNLVEENGEDANEAQDTDSNANTGPDECEERSLSLQVNTDLVSAIVIDKDLGNSNLGGENSPVGVSVTVSATEHDNQQSNTAEEEPVLVSGQDRTKTPPESGAAYDHIITRKELLSNGPNTICEQSMLEQQQPCLPLLPFGEKDSLEGSDQNGQQQKHMETVELSFATNETDLVPHREGIEPVELPLATDEKSHTDDCEKLEESPVIEKIEDAMREATDTSAGNGIQQNAETVESSVIINETNDMYKEGSENVKLPSQIDETEGVPNECFKAVEQLCAIDETKGGVGAEAPSDEKQPNEMIEERPAIEKLPEPVRDYQVQTRSIFLNGSKELPKFISLDENNVDDGPTINLQGDSFPTVQGGAQINGESVKAGAYLNDDDESSVMKNELPAKAVSQTSFQSFEALRMDEGLTENILVPDQWNEEKLLLQASEVMAKTTSEMLPSSNFSEPIGSNAEEQFTIPTTEVPKNSSPTSSFGTVLTHKGPESQDLQIIEGDDKASTLLREKVLKIHATKRASIWDCCGFWDWLHAHED